MPGSDHPPSSYPPSGYPPIEEHAVIGDLRTVALVATDGTIDWYCPQRFDGASVFASLLDADRGGSFRIHCSRSKAKQLYLPDSNVLLTRFLTPHSVGEVVDFMVPVDNDLTETPHVIVRQARAVRGTAGFNLRCDPRFDYGRASHTVTLVPGAGAVFESAAGTLVLRTALPLRLEGTAVTCAFELAMGETSDIVLEWNSRIRPLAPGEADEMFARTLSYWQTWLRRGRYQGRWREMVLRSALVLKLLVYRPTGALIAAPTTSLPEELGGVRNWDYRYTWIRDAAFTTYALMALGFTDEAAAFMDWLEQRCKEAPPGRGLRVLYSVDGNANLDEIVLDHLAGYRGSKPVRIGNGAADQLQLDIYGELMDSVYLYNKRVPISFQLWEALGRQLDWLGRHWEQPDEGIWETRGGRQRFTYSAVMTWVAFERACRISRQRGLPGPTGDWKEHAGRAYRFVQNEAWDPRNGAYMEFPGSPRLDASLLCMPLVKFSGPTDPRFLSTLDRVGTELVSDSLVRRYAADGSDGITGDEGTFNLCSFWYVEALTRAGRITEARMVFEKMLTYANHVGLYAEEIGPSGEALGNFPQAFTHLALISAAIHLDRALP
ncbi:glycoside hydrolase family 15 protein [Parafrankia sp. EUN1f]|uniref:glycoside hydrolase family 15 protein n=1 Tax=Parafrankia sp. EUN1f TaxID=102897 RepID=UPI0001C46719|nr:glycoside hydrolase family 15 protein [Parafrankia sp. EUN1f]EFC83549.1 glycoside hydrolase 15-related protein [Parafrankia sp. EUN1f]